MLGDIWQFFWVESRVDFSMMSFCVSFSDIQAVSGDMRLLNFGLLVEHHSSVNIVYRVLGIMEG